MNGLVETNLDPLSLISPPWLRLTPIRAFHPATAEEDANDSTGPGAASRLRRLLHALVILCNSHRQHHRGPLLLYQSLHSWASSRSTRGWSIGPRRRTWLGPQSPAPHPGCLSAGCWTLVPGQDPQRSQVLVASSHGIRPGKKLPDGGTHLASLLL